MKNEGLHTDILYKINEIYSEIIIERGKGLIDTYKYLDSLGGILND